MPPPGLVSEKTVPQLPLVSKFLIVVQLEAFTCLSERSGMRGYAVSPFSGIYPDCFFRWMVRHGITSIFQRQRTSHRPTGTSV